MQEIVEPVQSLRIVRRADSAADAADSAADAADSAADAANSAAEAAI